MRYKFRALSIKWIILFSYFEKLLCAWLSKPLVLWVSSHKHRKKIIFCNLANVFGSFFQSFFSENFHFLCTLSFIGSIKKAERSFHRRDASFFPSTKSFLSSSSNFNLFKKNSWQRKVGRKYETRNEWLKFPINLMRCSLK